MIPISASIFGTTWLDLYAVGIAYAQHWKQPYHVGLKFGMEDGPQIGFEASYSKNGFIRFPFLEKSLQYRGYQNAMCGRTMRTIRLPISSNQIETLFIGCKRAVGTVERYPQKWRVVYKLLHQRRGWPMRNTPNIADCSEEVARRLFEIGIDLRDGENDQFDELSPSEVWVNMTKKLEGELSCFHVECL